MTPLTDQYDELLHYTTIEGLIGIVSTGRLRASHAAFLNDSEESQHYYNARLPSVAAEVIGEALLKQSTAAGVAHGSGDERFEHLRAIKAEALVRQVRAATLSFNDPYVFAMSAADDERVARSGLLSQWRGYGPDGGYCIVFDTKEMEAFLTREFEAFHYQQIHWGDVYYYGHTPSQPAAGDVAENESVLRAGLLDLVNHGDVDRTPGFLQAIIMLSCVYKHWGFHEEHEVRVVAIPMRSDVMERIPPDERNAKAQKQILAFPRAGLAVPCLELSAGIGGRHLLPIRRVMVGPHRDSAARRDSIERLLVSHGYAPNVVVSEIPYIGR